MPLLAVLSTFSHYTNLLKKPCAYLILKAEYRNIELI